MIKVNTELLLLVYNVFLLQVFSFINDWSDKEKKVTLGSSCYILLYIYYDLDENKLRKVIIQANTVPIMPSQIIVGT